MEPIIGSAAEAGEDWLRYLRQKKCFCFGGVVLAQPGLFSEFQLLNPPGSRITVHVRFINVGATGGTDINLCTHDAPLATNIGPGANLWIGGPEPIAQSREASPAAADGNTITHLQRPLNTDSYRYADWVCILDPGKGILLRPPTVNNEVGAEFFWAELEH